MKSFYGISPTSISLRALCVFRFIFVSAGVRLTLAFLGSYLRFPRRLRVARPELLTFSSSIASVSPDGAADLAGEDGGVMLMDLSNDPSL